MKKVILYCIFCFFPINPVNIAITIDDHPMNNGIFSTQERTNKFVEIFKKHNVQAVFFCVGLNCIINDQDCLSLLSQNGHFLANHSFMHEHLSNYSIKRFKKEIVCTELILKKYITFKKWFRYPFLDYGNRINNGGSHNKKERACKVLKKLGYQEGFVTINTFDWHLNFRLKEAIKNGKNINWGKLKDLYVDLVKQWCCHYIDMFNDSGIQVDHALLLHANDLNALYLGDIVVMIKESGWDLVSPEKVFNNYQWKNDLYSGKTKLLFKKLYTLDCKVIDKLIGKAQIFY